MVGALTGGAAVQSGFSAWLAGQLSGLMGSAGPLLQQNAATFIGFLLAGAAVGLFAALSKRRMRAIEKKRIASMQAIAKSEQEIKRAIVGLVVLEYQRLATRHFIKVGVPVESEAIIHRKMEQLVFEVKKKHGYELPLPAEVERAVWPLLHRKRAGFFGKAWQMLHERLEMLFRGRNRAPSGQNCDAYAIDAYSMCAVA